jgi:hypothetical protein
MAARKLKLFNSQGEEITLNPQERRVVSINERFANQFGYEIDITSLTLIQKSVVEQKFFEIFPADYVPVRVGEGAWSTNLVTYRSFTAGDDFATGLINLGSGSGRLGAVDVGVDAVSVKVNNWAKQIGWTLPELQVASRAGNWDIVTAKERGRKKNWDLGIQRTIFLGLPGDNGTRGLLNQAITPNTTLITARISAMTAVQLNAFATTVLGAYRAATNYTAWPTHFVLPEVDFLGLGAPSSPETPLKSKLQVLMETFATMTNNPGFKILPLAYAQAAQSGLATDRYMLYRYDEDSLRADVPVDYTATLANTLDSFSYQNVGYGQFTGVMAYRPLEMFYMDLTPA